MNNVGISPTKSAIKDYVCMYCNARDVAVADEFDTMLTRHICSGSKSISLLNRSYVPVPTTNGIINVEVFYCNRCGKLILNKSSME